MHSTVWQGMPEVVKKSQYPHQPASAVAIDHGEQLGDVLLAPIEVTSESRVGIGCLGKLTLENFSFVACIIVPTLESSGLLMHLIKLAPERTNLAASAVKLTLEQRGLLVLAIETALEAERIPLFPVKDIPEACPVVFDFFGEPATIHTIKIKRRDGSA